MGRSPPALQLGMALWALQPALNLRLGDIVRDPPTDEVYGRALVRQGSNRKCMPRTSLENAQQPALLQAALAGLRRSVADELACGTRSMQ